MAENTDEDHLDSPPNIHLENPSDEITPTTDTEAIKQNQETEDMETHAQELHKAPGHGLKHYLFEFLMLFLAVFCGFLAENYREHRVEQERGKQYILSFCEDLKADTTNINFQIEELTSQESSLSKIFECYDSVTQKTPSTQCLRDIIFNSQGFSDFIYTDRTIQQLKYAGGLRLIQDNEIADSIIKYDAYVRALQIHQQVLENMQQIAINAHNSMIGFIQLQNLTDLEVKSNLFLLTTDKRELNKYFNEIATFKKGCLGQLSRLKKIKAMATRLLIFIRKKE